MRAKGKYQISVGLKLGEMCILTLNSVACGMTFFSFTEFTTTSLTFLCRNLATFLFY